MYKYFYNISEIIRLTLNTFQKIKVIRFHSTVYILKNQSNNKFFLFIYFMGNSQNKLINKQINDHKNSKSKLRNKTGVTVLEMSNLISKCPLVMVSAKEETKSKGYIFKPPPNHTLLSPMSKSIIDSIQDKDEQSRMTQLLAKDDMELEKLDAKEIIDDPDYIEKFANNQLGFFMEDYICAYGKCPFCQSKLYKFADPSMPAVDLICENNNRHRDREPYIFQVKISLTNKYFNNEYITVGTYKYGSVLNNISANSNYKHLIPTYICIKFKWKEGSNHKFVMKESFMIVPQLNKNNNKPFYTYTDDNKKIKWNEDMVRIKGIKTLFGTKYLQPFDPYKINFNYELTLNNHAVPQLNLNS